MVGVMVGAVMGGLVGVAVDVIVSVGSGHRETLAARGPTVRPQSTGGGSVTRPGGEAGASACR
jgi:hypothetical protein